MKKLILAFVASLTALASLNAQTVDVNNVRAKDQLSVGSGAGRVTVTSIVTTVNGSSTNAQLPTAQAVYNAIVAATFTVHRDTTLTGNGTSGSPLGLNQQGATSGQVLKYNGTRWAPASDVGSNVTAGAGITLLGSPPNITVTNTGDLSTSNEIQSLSLSGQALGISLGGTGVTLPIIGVSGGTGISVSVSSGTATVTNTGDTNASDDLTASTTFAGDVTGLWNALTVGKIQNRTVATTAPTNGQVYKWNSTSSQWEPSADNNSGGTVTSVALSLPSFLSVTGSPVTGSGTLTATLASQTQNLVFASPSGASGTPTFRALVGSDLPTLSSSMVSDFTEAAQDAVFPAVVAGSNITVSYNDAGNSLTISGAAGGGGISSLNALTAATQTFTTGTSGTDFNISSATSTHTFNLPTASATNRGALSSADWTTFNNSIDGSGTAGQVAYFSGTSALTSSTNLRFTGTQLAINKTTPADALDVVGNIRGANRVSLCDAGGFPTRQFNLGNFDSGGDAVASSPYWHFKMNFGASLRFWGILKFTLTNHSNAETFSGSGKYHEIFTSFYWNGTAVAAYGLTEAYDISKGVVVYKGADGDLYIRINRTRFMLAHVDAILYSSTADNSWTSASGYTITAIPSANAFQGGGAGTVYSPSSSSSAYKFSVGDANGSLLPRDNFVIDASDQAGFGTASPDARLTVQGAGSTSGSNSFRVKNASGAISLGVRGDGGVQIPGSVNTASSIMGRDGSGWISSVSLGATLALTSGTLGLAQQSATTGQVLQWSGTAWAPATISTGSGTVTSVGLSLPSSIFSVSGSPVTGSGTLTAALATQTANTVFAGPTTGAAAAPTFRTLVTSDLPPIPTTSVTGFDEGAQDATAAAFAAGSHTGISVTYNDAANSLSLALTGDLYRADGSLTGNRTVTLGSNALVFVTNNSTSAAYTGLVSQTFNNSGQPNPYFTGRDQLGADRFYINGLGTTIALRSVNGDISLQSNSSGVKTLTWTGAGGLSFPPSTISSPTNGTVWVNASGDVAFQKGGATRTVANVEDDLTGAGVTVTSGPWTVGGTVRTILADASGGSITLTLGANMQEGRDYYIATRNNGSGNTITMNAASGYQFLQSGNLSYTFTATAVAQTHYIARRVATTIYLR